jgi:hypothetical protein
VSQIIFLSFFWINLLYCPDVYERFNQKQQ